MKKCKCGSTEFYRIPIYRQPVEFDENDELILTVDEEYLEDEIHCYHCDELI